jgi:hydrogenase maturation protease
MKTLIIGLGNPILGDDGVGWKVAQEIARQLPTLAPDASAGVTNYQSPIEVDCVALGGLSLMERMVGYQRAILVDSMETGQSPEGSVRVFPLEALTNPSASHSTAAHDTSLLTALEVGRKMKMQVPDSVTVVAIEAKNVYDFSEELSPAVAEAVPVACEAVLELLEKEIA